MPRVSLVLVLSALFRSMDGVGKGEIWGLRVRCADWGLFVLNAGKEGAPAKEDVTGALDGTEKKAEELAGKGS